MEPKEIKIDMVPILLAMAIAAAVGVIAGEILWRLLIYIFAR